MDDHPQPHPPRCMQNDEPEAANDARRRVREPASKKRLRFSFRRRQDRQREDSQGDDRPAVILNDDTEQDLVGLDSISHHRDDQTRDVYKWAVVYENQRGMTVFSIPYYSSLSLLPNDPPPFTIPDPECGGRQPKVSLEEYPLPDGTWRWVSKAWMIDMRGDGAVQYDGFEYNWFFRRHHWRAEVGSFNAGGWVRRRRWLRLMVKPATHKPHRSQQGHGTQLSSSEGTLSVAGSSQPPSVLDMVTDGSGHVAAIGEVWRGNVEEDWLRCQELMKRFGRDGRKLELWRTWLSGYVPSSGTETTSPRKQWTEDSKFMPSEVEHAQRSADVATAAQTLNIDKQAIAAVIRCHGRKIVESFVYPDTRAQFLELLAEADLLPEITSGLGMVESTTSDLVDFWSYNASIAEGDKLGTKGKQVIRNN